ncbi:RNA-binding protein 42-like isoform X2 [Bolinopsis microptera]|uniref:RNA-binding protein 42-like isoform X2 n=1 Tax=Bolinopsis microptera TaxID=2820187 RepID=UPI00307AF632
MGSLEQQMALFEELISQEQAPTNGILVPTQTLVSLAPGFINRPNPVQVVTSRPAGIIASTAYRGPTAVQVTGLQPPGIVTTVVSRPRPVVTSIPAQQLRPSLTPMRSIVNTAHIVNSTPSLDNIPLPRASNANTVDKAAPAPGSTAFINIHPSRIPLPPTPAPPPTFEPEQPQQKRAKITPRLYEKQSESLELKAAIAKATAAANATNSQKYPQPQMNHNPHGGSHRNQQYQGQGQGRAPLPGPRPPGQGMPPPPPPMGPLPPHMRPPPPPHMVPPPPHMGHGPHPGQPMPPMMPPDQMNMFFQGMPPTSTPNPEDAVGQGEVANKKGKKKGEKRERKMIRTAAGDVWEDTSLMEWDDNDFRIFVGDIGNECNDEMLYRAFSKYPSLVKVKVIRDKRSNKTKGYGFASFKDSADYVKAMREVNGKYIGNRPCKLRKSSWKDRQLTTVRKKNNEKQKLGLKI